jgi:hypothetical protein
MFAKSPTFRCDDNDTGWRALAAIQFNPVLALELGLRSLASDRLRAIGSFAAEVKGRGPVRAPHVSGGEPLVTAAETRCIASERRWTRRVRAGTRHDAKTGSSFTLGAGAEYSFGKLGVRAEWQRYDNVASGTDAESDIVVFSVGLLFRF